MLQERAIAISIPLQKRSRGQTSGSRMPSGKKSMRLPRALWTQNAWAVDPAGRFAAEQVSDATLGRTSIPPVPAASRRELRFGESVTAASAER